MDDELLKNSYSDNDNLFEEELEVVNFFRTIHSLSPLRTTRDYYYQMLTDKQNESILLLQKLIDEDSKEREFRLPPVQNKVSVTNKDIKTSNKNINVNLRIPVITGAKNQTSQSQLNKAMEDDIMEFKRQMEEAALEESKAAKKSGKKFIPYNISNVYNLTHNKNNIVSVTILYYQNIGGKSYYIKTSYNYDLNTGKSLSIGDLFKPGVNYKAIINEAIRKQLAQNKTQYFPGTLESFKGIADDQPFYLEGNNLVVFFGFNEIAPVESQIPVIRIPLYQLGNVLKPQFL